MLGPYEQIIVYSEKSTVGTLCWISLAYLIRPRSDFRGDWIRWDTGALPNSSPACQVNMQLYEQFLSKAYSVSDMFTNFRDSYSKAHCTVHAIAVCVRKERHDSYKNSQRHLKFLNAKTGVIEYSFPQIFSLQK